jgi:hypothetical protein
VTNVTQNSPGEKWGVAGGSTAGGNGGVSSFLKRATPVYFETADCDLFTAQIEFEFGGE